MTGHGISIHVNFRGNARQDTNLPRLNKSSSVPPSPVEQSLTGAVILRGLIKTASIPLVFKKKPKDKLKLWQDLKT